MILLIVIYQSFMKSNRRKTNCNIITTSLFYKMFLLPNRNLTFSKDFISHLSLLCIFACFLVIFIGIDTKYGKHNIVNSAWSDKINGTEQADTIIGTANKDIIKGFYGNDALSGKEAGDNISGGSGDDMIYGNEGRDILKGKAGNDRIEGGEGKDRLFGDRGNDVLVGGQDNDTLTGGIGMDTFICGNGTDLLTDFNITQKDSTPENDCENLKNSNVKTKSLSPQQNLSSAVTKDNNQITDNKSNNVNTTDQNKKVDDFFFGLFK